MPTLFIYLSIGALAGICAGLFGIGGGVVLVPALVYWAGFSQQAAIGTSVAVLLPPIGIAAAYEYARHGHVDLRAALILAVAMAAGSWGGAVIANRIGTAYLRLAFAGFVCVLGVYLLTGACRNLRWL